ncbi:MAG: acetylglutamate kinase [Streptomycetaceae bacterium]|nr:MAG: acetylglutamate kinase [Streptomycetaceae bacterium]
MIVIKFGGNAMTDVDGLFAEAVQAVLDIGQECVIVHGGGPQINEALAHAGIEPSFFGGFRVTSPAVFKVVQSVLSGSVLRDLVAQLRNAGINAVGITGRDGGLLVAQKLTELVDGTPADLGQVGEVIRVDTSVLTSLLASGFVPVISPIAVEGDDSDEISKSGLNVNADLAAGAIAGALGADSLIFMTDVPGIYRNWPEASSFISSITYKELNLIKGEFAEGMAPKVLATLNAIALGAASVRVIDGKDPQAFSLALRGLGGTVVTR